MELEVPDYSRHITRRTVLDCLRHHTGKGKGMSLCQVFIGVPSRHSSTFSIRTGSSGIPSKKKKRHLGWTFYSSASGKTLFFPDLDIIEEDWSFCQVFIDALVLLG